MNTWQKEHFDTLQMIRSCMSQFSSTENNHISELAEDYLQFRHRTAIFLETHFSGICTRKCYENHLSACCSKDGILAFFADLVINTMVSTPKDIDSLISVLTTRNTTSKCIYLTDNGCLWKIKPIVCEMFLCDRAKEEAFHQNDDLKDQWQKLERQKKDYTWPDKPVLFDTIEQIFIQKGLDSPLMYLHKSPGLLRLKGHRKK